MGNGQWALGIGQWGIKKLKIVMRVLIQFFPCPMPNAPCPMPHAPCPMP
ncbi:hypothetical protein [Scytonema hofmannii]|nr:hypothetical protein [Scytonema hofmannii]